MNINILNKEYCLVFAKKTLLSILLFTFIFLSNTNINAQCNQNYDWAVWSNFTGNNALGTINYNGSPISVNMSANYNFNSTPTIFNYPKFNGFSSVVPNTTVPRTEWTAGVGGVTTMCFSQTVSNPILLLSSLGNPSTAVTLTLSKNYVVVYDGGAMTYVDDTTIIGQEGFAIIMFPGNFDCVSIFSSTPEYYTNITWGLNPPLFSVGMTGNTPSCDSVTLTASGGVSYQWNGGTTPSSATNTFLSSGTYILTVTDALNCIVTTSETIVISPLDTTILNETICQGDTFVAGGVHHTTSGNYVYNLQTAEGCDSIVALNLTIGSHQSTTFNETICQNQAFIAGGVIHVIGGTYVYNLQTYQGCDSIVTLNLTINPNQSTILTENICQGQTFVAAGITHSLSGNYTYNLQTYLGCDSIVTLNLTVNSNQSTILNEDICQGQTFTAGGVNHTNSGTYIYNLQTYLGCDSMVTLNLSVDPIESTTLTEVVCAGLGFEVGGINHTTSGSYIHILQTYKGCDSTVTLHLTIEPILSTSVTEIICKGEVFEGYSETGIYLDTLTLNNGCLIIRTLDLTVLENSSFTESITICEGTTYNGYSQTGTYADTTISINGCDSIYTLYLEVILDYFSLDTVSICENEVYNFRGREISEEGLYTDNINSPLGCDSTFSVYIKIVDEPFLGIDTMLCMAEGFRLYAPNENTIWYDNTISSSNKVTETGMYWATTIDNAGCEITDSIYIEFNFNSFIPNGFTPNNDGFNDCFFPNFSDNPFFISYKMIIVDRWGSLVFSTDNPNDCWNGEFINQKCPSAVYVYFIELQTDTCPKMMLKGDITLIR